MDDFSSPFGFNASSMVGIKDANLKISFGLETFVVGESLDAATLTVELKDGLGSGVVDLKLLGCSFYTYAHLVHKI